MGKKVTQMMVADAPEVIAYGTMTGDFVNYLALSLGMYKGAASACVNVRWNCPGGSTVDGTAAYNSLLHSSPLAHVYVDGIAASMGYYSICGASKIFISRFGRVMLHQASCTAGGNADELRESAEQADATDASLIGMVCKRTGMTEAAARTMFFNGKDNWYGAREALALGLVDGIYDLEDADGMEAATPMQIFAMVQDFSNEPKNKQIMTTMTAEALAELGLTASATPEQVMVAQQSRMTLMAQQMKQQKELGLKAEVKTLLDKALTVDKKITADLRTLLEGQYGTNPTGLTALLDKMPGFVSVTEALNVQAANRGGGMMTFSPIVVGMMAKGWDALDKSGEMKQLHAQSPEAYRELYKSKFGCYPNERVRDMGQVTRDIAHAKAQGNVIQA